MRGSRFNPLTVPVRILRRDDMRLLGIERTSALGSAWNKRRFGDSLAARRRGLDRHLQALATERERAARPAPAVDRLTDGWARDDSRSLPHLERVIEEMGEVIAERGGREWPFHGKPFLYDILPEHAWERYGSLLDFITTPEVLEPVARQSGFIPCLSGDTPPGMRVMESSMRFDPQATGPWRSSQLWHIDYHADPTIYVIVALKEIGPDDGPLHFLGQLASKRIAEELGYGRRGSSYRVSDEAVEALVDPSEIHTFTGPAGNVLFIDSSRCFHFGSRRPRNPRYQLQYAYVSPVRNDFGDLVRAQARYPLAEEAPLSRRLALDRAFGG